MTDAIEIVSDNNLPGDLLRNINISVSTIKPPMQCLLDRRFSERLRQRIIQAIEGMGFYQYEIQSLGPVTIAKGKPSLSQELTVVKEAVVQSVQRLLEEKSNPSALESHDQSPCPVWQLGITVGAPVSIDEIAITLNGYGQRYSPFKLLIDDFPLTVGDRLDHQQYEKAKTLFLSTASHGGFFDARWTRSNILVDRDNNTASIYLDFETGERYKFGELLNTLSDSDRELILSFRPFLTGEPYNSQKLNMFSQRLKGSGFFVSVMVRPVVQMAKDFHVPMELIFQFKPKNEYAIGGGVNSDTGVRGKASWKRSRLNAAAHSIEAEALLSLPEQSLGLKYRIPLTDPALNFISIQSGFRRLNDNDTQSDIFSLSIKRHWWSNNGIWQNVGHLRLKREQFVQGSAAKQATTLVMPGATFSRFRSDGELYPMWGDRQLLTLEVGDKLFASDIDVARTLFQTRWLRLVKGQIPLRVLLRMDLGALSSSDFNQVPSSLRFFAGGDQSIRGFGFQTLSPLNEDGELLGGKYLYTLSSEVSFSITRNWRLAAFVDAGNAGDSILENMATGIGVGVHWLTPVGPLRVYVARGHSDIENTWRLHFSFGSAL